MRRNDQSMHPERWMLKRNIALGIAVLVIMFLVFTFPGIRAVHGVYVDQKFALENNGMIDGPQAYWYMQRLTKAYPYDMKLNQEILCVIFCAVGFGSAMTLFRHLFSRKQAMMTAALPVSRKRDLLQRTECFAILTLLPSLVCFALYPLAAAAYGVSSYLDMGLYTVRCIAVLMMEIYGYVLGILCSSLCGTIWSAALAGIVLGASCETIWYGWLTMAHDFLNTMVAARLFDPLKKMSPVISMYKAFGDPTFFSWVPGVLAILLLTVLALFAYRENRPENVGRTLNIRKIEIPVSIWVMLFGISAVLIVAQFIFNVELYVWLCVAVGAAVIWILLRMALDQNIRLSLKNWIIPAGCLATALLVMLGMRLDVTGYNRRLPEAGELKAVEYKYQGYQTVRLENEESCATFLQLAGMMRDQAEGNRSARHFAPNPYQEIIVTYETDHGTWRRAYTQPADAEAALPLWKIIVEGDEYKAAQKVPEGEKISVSGALPTFGIWGSEFKSVYGFEYGSDFRIDEQEVIEALRKDLQDRTFEDLQKPTVLDIAFSRHDENSGKELDYTFYTIHTCDENTLRAILKDDMEKWIDYANGGFMTNEDILVFVCNYVGDTFELADYEIVKSPEEAMKLYREIGFCDIGLYKYPADSRHRLQLYQKSQIQDNIDNGYTNLGSVDWERLPEYENKVPGYTFYFQK